jgi:hypothetical protein
LIVADTSDWLPLFVRNGSKFWRCLPAKNRLQFGEVVEDRQFVDAMADEFLVVNPGATKASLMW